MENFKMVTFESRTFNSIDEMFDECKNMSGIIPAAAVKIADKPYMPMVNVFDAIRTASVLKNIGHKQVSLAIYTPEFTEAGTICLITTVYE